MGFMSFMHESYRKVLPEPNGFYTNLLVEELKGCNSILDLGCGRNSRVKFVNAPFKVGVDAFKPYLEESRRKKVHHKYILKDITKLKMKPKSFDAVIALDAIEHLNRKDGLRLIRNMENWAKEKIIIFTPNGFVNQQEYDGNLLQLHKSGWTLDDFKKLGFKVHGINGFRLLRKEKAELRFKPRLFTSVISDISQKFTFFLPQYAFQLFAVRSLKACAQK
jgi:hypothetical protein